MMSVVPFTSNQIFVAANQIIKSNENLLINDMKRKFAGGICCSLADEFSAESFLHHIKLLLFFFSTELTVTIMMFLYNLIVTNSFNLVLTTTLRHAPSPLPPTDPAPSMPAAKESDVHHFSIE